MAKKFLALLGVFCALVACFALPLSASWASQPSDTFTAVSYTYQGYNTSGNGPFFTLPITVGPTTTFTTSNMLFAWGGGTVDRMVTVSTSPSSGYTVDVRLTSPVTFPLDDRLSTIGDRFTYDVDDWEAQAEYLVVFPDGQTERGVYDYREGVARPGMSTLAEAVGVAHVRDYLRYTYPTAVRGYVLSLEIEGLSTYAGGASSQVWSSETLYSPVSADDINVTIFDGSVGAGELLLSPLEAFFGFEIFPNFSIGDIFGVIIAILLFVVVLKLFAGG